MPARNFLTVPYASAFTLDADQSKSFQVTLTGSPTITLAGGRDGDEITVAITQGGSGGYSPTWANVTWQAGNKPNLNSAVGGLDTITLIRQGSTWTDKGGAPSKFPSRITAVALATLALVGTGSGMRYVFSGGNNEGAGGLTQAIEIRTKSGAQVNAVINASGSYLNGSGTNVVGAITERPAQTLGSVVQKVRGGPKSTNGSGTVIVNGSKGGQFCYADTDGTGYTMCTGNNGTQTCKVATGNECL